MLIIVIKIAPAILNWVYFAVYPVHMLRVIVLFRQNSTVVIVHLAKSGYPQQISTIHRHVSINFHISAIVPVIANVHKVHIFLVSVSIINERIRSHRLPMILDGTCDCVRPLWFWSYTANQCLPCESQGYILIRYSSQWVCTRLINSSLLSYSASQSACTNLGWSLISPIVASDIPVIARTYSTYRLWINIQTSLSNSTYINNLFPNNQSNWNTYVLSPSIADYFSYIYALQIISSYNQTMLFEGNININTGQALCILY